MSDIFSTPSPDDHSILSSNSLPQFDHSSESGLKSRQQRALEHIEASQASPKEKRAACSLVERAFLEPRYGQLLLLAIERCALRSENPVTPLRGMLALQQSDVDPKSVNSEHLIAIGRVLADVRCKSAPAFVEMLCPTLFQIAEVGAPAGAIVAIFELALPFHDHIVFFKRVDELQVLRCLACDFAELDPTKDDAHWIVDRAKKLSSTHMLEEAIADLENCVDGLGIALQCESRASRDWCIHFLRERLTLGEAMCDPITVVGLMRAIAPLLSVQPIRFDIIQRYVELLEQVIGNEEDDSGPRPDSSLALGSEYIANIASRATCVEDLEDNLMLIEKIKTSNSGRLYPNILPLLTRLNRVLSAAESTGAQWINTTLDEVLPEYVVTAQRLEFLIGTLELATRSRAPVGWTSLVQEVLSIHREASVEELLRVLSSCRSLTHPSAPPDLIRTYLTAMQDVRFRSERASASLLARLGLHAALYVLPEATTRTDIALGLRPIGELLKVEPHLFIQEEPDADEYRELQMQFYPRIREAYRADTEQGRGRDPDAKKRKPFHLLTPPLQRSLGAFMRLADIHHGFGVQAIPSRRTPDGETPLLLRFGIGHGKVSMLNTNDNNHFPGKGLAISKLDPALLFAARPANAPEGSDPFILYRRAWPSLSQAIDQLPRAQFIFSRGMIVIAGVDQKYYSIEIEGTRHQYSLVIFNAHFDNPFNEVALAVPSQILQDFFRGTIESVDNYSGFNPRRQNARVRIPNPRIFHRHPTLGKYVINVGLPKNILMGLMNEAGSEHLAWNAYRNDAVAYERRLRSVDRGFAEASGQQGRRASRELLQHQSALSGIERLSPSVHLYSEEMALLKERPKLIERFESLDTVVDPVERGVWQFVNRSLDLYDLYRFGYAYYTRGITTPRSGKDEEDEIEIELGEADDAGFNPGGELTLRELYRGHALHGVEGVGRERFPIVLSSDVLYSARFGDPAIMIDSFDMRGFVNNRAVQFSPGEMTEEDLGVWQTSVLSQIKDTAGTIPAFQIVERGMLPKKILEKLDSFKRE